MQNHKSEQVVAVSTYGPGIESIGINNPLLPRLSCRIALHGRKVAFGFQRIPRRRP